MTIYVDEELLRRIEEMRGDVPRSRYIAKLIRLGLSVVEESERRAARAPLYR